MLFEKTSDTRPNTCESQLIQRRLNYDKFYVQGTVHTEGDEAYTSHNTNRLVVDGVVKKIMGTDYVKEELEGRPRAVEA